MVKSLPSSKKTKQNHVEIIDLEASSPSCDNPNTPSKLPKANGSKKAKETHSDWSCATCTHENDSIALACKVCGEARIKSRQNNDLLWSCHNCTFVNRPLALTCDVCYAERISSMKAKSIDNTSTHSKKREANNSTDEVSQRKKLAEIEKSRKDFNGFNIYGGMMTQ